MINIKRLIYSLKKRYGVPVDFYREYDSQTDIESGLITQYRKKYHIDYAVYLDQTAIGRGPLTQILDQLAGVMQTADVAILLSGDDFYDSFKPHLKDYLIIDHRRYEIVTIQQIDDYESLYLTIKEYKGSILYEQHNVYLKDKLNIIQLLNATKTHTYAEYLSDTINWYEQLNVNNDNTIYIADTLSFTDCIQVNYPLTEGKTYTRFVNDYLQFHETLIYDCSPTYYFIDTINFNEQIVSSGNNIYEISITDILGFNEPPTHYEQYIPRIFSFDDTLIFIESVSVTIAPR